MTVQDTDFSTIDFKLVATRCPLCHADHYRDMGVRGNREYYEADPSTTPHVYTHVVQCKTCDFIYTNPIIKGAEQLENLYYSSPEAYQADDLLRVESMFKNRLDFISGYTSSFPLSLLDIGAGKGEFLAEALKRGWQVEGVEPSLKFCEYAKSNYNILIHHGYIGDNVKLSDKFSIVTLNHVLEHIDQPESFLKHLQSYLTKDGILYIEVPNTDSWLLRMADLVFRMKGKNWSSRLSPMHPPFHKYGYTKKSMRYLIKKCGYELVKIKTFNGKDRGYKYSKRSLSIILRDAMSMLNDLLGNRELLAVIVKIK
jgi:SAM-dependent methyltransferase